MLGAARVRFADERGVEFIRHDLTVPLPDIGTFDVVVSCFAIHHVDDARKRSLYAECFDRLVPGGRALQPRACRPADPTLAQRLLSGAGPGLER